MNLLDIVNQKAQSLDMQYAKAQVIPSDQIVWEQTKQIVERLPVNLDYVGGLMKKKLNIPNGIRKDSFGKCGKEKCFENTTRLEIDLDSDTYPMMFISYSCPKHGTKNAQYVAFNYQKNSVYLKRLIVNYEPEI